MTPPAARPTRRALVVGGCAGAVAACLAGCARYGQAQGPAPELDQPTPPLDAAQPSAGAPAADAPGTGISLAAAEVPVGGGVVLADQGVVVTQPSAGTFAAFDVTCPHQGCAVNEVADGLIVCPCHGSTFRVADGSVAEGPAPTGLARREASLDGARVRVV